MYVIILSLSVAIISLYMVLSIEDKSFPKGPIRTPRSIPSYSHILLVYMTCGEPYYPPPEMKIPSIEIKCDNQFNYYQCHETGPYLKFIIDHYQKPLADIYIFIHGHETSWHYPTPITEAIDQLSSSKYIEENAFGGLECFWNYVPAIIQSNPVFNELYNYFFSGTTISVVPQMFWSYPCCSTFFVHSKSIKLRQLDEYKSWFSMIQTWSRKFANNNPGKDPAIYCGRVFEGLWNVVLANVTYVKVPPYCNELKTNPPLIESDTQNQNDNNEDDDNVADMNENNNN